MANQEVNLGDSTYQICCQFIIILLTSIPMIVLQVGGTPIQRGFYCDDQSIKYPFIEEDTVYYTTDVLPFGLCIICGTMIIIEALHCIKSSRKTSFCGCEVWVYFPQVTSTILSLGIATMLVLSISDMLRFSIGRLRPSFLAICRPNLTAELCMDAHGYNRYVTNYTCTSWTTYWDTESRLSFPSGHTSTSFVFAVYYCIYLQRRMTWRWSVIPRYLLQVSGLCLAGWVGLTRIFDYRHHPTDVLGGGALGVIVAMLVAFFMTDLLNSKAKDTDIERSEYERLK